MKKMKCDMCDKEFAAETFDEWFKIMQGHYMADHAEFMKQSQNKTKHFYLTPVVFMYNDVENVLFKTLHSRRSFDYNFVGRAAYEE